MRTTSGQKLCQRLFWETIVFLSRLIPRIVCFTLEWDVIDSFFFFIKSSFVMLLEIDWSKWTISQTDSNEWNSCHSFYLRIEWGGKRWSKPRPKNNQIKQIQKNGLLINDLNFNNFCGFSKFRLATWPLMFDIWLPISRHFICYIRFVWVDLIRFCSSQTSVVCLLLCFFFSLLFYS